MRLSDIIQQKIQANGPISFRDYMDMCLYYPGFGYYASQGDKIGRNGDFYTSSSLSPVFGAMIGRQLEEMWAIMGKKQFTIVECGAGTGELCHDILHYLEANNDFYSKLNYYIVEKSPSMRQKEKKYLHEKVTWHDTLAEVPPVSGCILSNELVDNFPVHQIVMQHQLMEVFVDFRDEWCEVLQPASPAINNYLHELHIYLPDGYRTEVNLDAIKWVSDIATTLKTGYVITIDYGYTTNELYCRHHREGTLMCYNQHRLNALPYTGIGEQDITAHVNFSALTHWGTMQGLSCCGYTQQGHFLAALGLTDHLLKMASGEPFSLTGCKQQAFLKHILLYEMGSKFKVLIQGKNVPDHPLSGLKLSNQQPALV